MAQVRLQLHILNCVLSLQARILDVSFAELESILCHFGEVESAPSPTEHGCLCPYFSSDAGVMMMMTLGGAVCPVRNKTDTFAKETSLLTREPSVK